MSANFDAQKWLNTTRLVEEVPGVEEHERYYIWHDRKVVWKGATADEGRDWAAENSIVIEEFERFEP